MFNDYLKKHKDDLDKHVLGAESDGGGGRVHTLVPGVGDTSLLVINEMHKLIAPLGIVLSEDNNAKGGSDMSVLGEAGMPALNFNQNLNDYFKYHHTPNDTFDKIIAEDMRYLTAAYSTIFYLAAEMPVDLDIRMKKLILISAMILCGASYAQESFTIDDALRMGNVDDVKILPDGSSVFYSISSLDWSKNERDEALLSCIFRRFVCHGIYPAEWV